MVRRNVLSVDGEHNRIAHRIEVRKALDEGVHDPCGRERLGQVAEFDLARPAGLGEVGEELYGEAHEASVSVVGDDQGRARGADRAGLASPLRVVRGSGIPDLRGL